MSDLTEELDTCTMESTHKNLFFIGMCSREMFQRFSLGHAVAAAETIKRRLHSESS